MQLANGTHYRRLEIVLLCPWPPSWDPGRPFSDLRPADLLTVSELRTNSKLPSALLIYPLGRPHRIHFFLQLLCWCMRRSVTCSVVASLSAWRRTAWKTPLTAVASLLSDATAVAKTRLLCHCLATCLGFQKICHSMYHFQNYWTDTDEMWCWGTAEVVQGI
jgi:hypothetical protein